MSHDFNGNGNGNGNGKGNGAPSRNGERAASGVDAPSADTARFLKTPRRVLITGGAGFIGTNLAAKLLEQGHFVEIYDNLSRLGVERNLGWLVRAYGRRVVVRVEDIRDADAVKEAVSRADVVLHFAAQVAVTTSLEDPIGDFEVNVQGALNVLEACRRCIDPPRLLFTSTNKVYGALDDVPLTLAGDRYLPEDPSLRAHGVSEARRLDFHSPYGCSKGAADQYVLDYARCYGLPAAVFRMSCIYGPHQCGNEDQGWVAHFVRQTLAGEPIVFYGDGCQVRDLLYVDDLARAMLAAINHMGQIKGQAFNMGGGPDNAASLIELVREIARLHGEAPAVQNDEWRQGDQRYYVTDCRAFQEAASWRPRVSMSEGVRRLYEWLRAQDAPSRLPRPASGRPRAKAASHR